jgi:ligand-binding SRPBCC domain-containing protein
VRRWDLQPTSQRHEALGRTRIELVNDIAAPVERVFDLARDIGVHERSLARTGERAVDGGPEGRIEVGETVRFRARHLGIWWQLESRITAMEPPTRFVDEQVTGPFARFRHERRFDEVEGGTRMTDSWEHGLRFGVLGRIADRLVVQRLVRGLLSDRARALAQEAEQGSRP